MSTALLLLPRLLAFSQAAPEPDTHLHVHLPPEGGQGESPNTGAGGLAANGLNARIGGYDYADDALKAKKGSLGNGAPSGKDKDEIDGGVFASGYEFPFLATFFKSSAWTGRCAGALISPRHVITSWHCFQDKVSKLTQVGFKKIYREPDYTITIQVQRFVFHPTLDVAILVLERERDGIKPIRLPAEDDGCDYNGQTITLVGPGDGPRYSQTEALLKKVDLEAYTGNKTSPNTGKKCVNQEGREFVCATSLKQENWGSGGSGDSGAPMMICRKRKAKNARDCKIVGVLTGGIGANFATDFNFKSDSVGPCVSALRPWIDSVMKETAGEKWSLEGIDDDDDDNDDNDNNKED